jgi:hypothetical protein
MPAELRQPDLRRRRGEVAARTISRSSEIRHFAVLRDAINKTAKVVECQNEQGLPESRSIL